MSLLLVLFVAGILKLLAEWHTVLGVSCCRAAGSTDIWSKLRARKWLKMSPLTTWLLRKQNATFSNLIKQLLKCPLLGWQDSSVMTDPSVILGTHTGQSENVLHT